MSMGASTSAQDLDRICRAVLAAAKEKEYAGYSKFDALNSPFLSRLSGNSAWMRFAFTQMIKISPINLRPLFGVRISPNPKGIALFARAHLSRYVVDGDPQDLVEAKRLLDWLIEHRVSTEEEFAWGYNYTWQDVPPFVQLKGEPISIVTIFAGEAFLRAYEVIGEARFLDIALSASRFLSRRLSPLLDTSNERAMSYTIGSSGAERSIVVNIQALSAAFYAKLGRWMSDPVLDNIARRQINFVLSCETPDHAWFYTHPSTASHIRHDNYHTGGVLDALLEYAEVANDERVFDAYDRGLDFYDRKLFEADGAPRWMNDSKFPHDVHGSAQGIISFAQASRRQPLRLARAEQAASWAAENLYRSDRRDFLYRKGRFMKYDYSLMHWCNGWMTRALGELAEARAGYRSGRKFKK